MSSFFLVETYDLREWLGETRISNDLLIKATDCLIRARFALVLTVQDSIYGRLRRPEFLGDMRLTPTGLGFDFAQQIRDFVFHTHHYTRMDRLCNTQMD